MDTGKSRDTDCAESNPCCPSPSCTRLWCISSRLWWWEDSLIKASTGKGLVEAELWVKLSYIILFSKQVTLAKIFVFFRVTHYLNLFFQKSPKMQVLKNEDITINHKKCLIQKELIPPTPKKGTIYFKRNFLLFVLHTWYMLRAEQIHAATN